MISKLRQKYVKIAKSLKNKKTFMLKKKIFIDEFVRRIFFVKILLQNSIDAKKKTFRFFQKRLFFFQIFDSFQFYTSVLHRCRR